MSQAKISPEFEAPIRRRATPHVVERPLALAAHAPDHALAAAYPLFDWLRFVLASVVVLGHSAIIPWEAAPFLAVQVFFALSGWLIGSILLRSTPEDIPRFFFNRGTRIWIPYFGAIALLYAVSLLRDPVTASWLDFLAYDVSFTHNLYSLKPSPLEALPVMPLAGTGNHFWSIAVEEQFYLAAPLLILLVPGGRSPWLWGPLAVLAVVSVSWFGAISLGVLAASLRHRFGDWHRRPTVEAALMVTAALLLGLLAGGVGNARQIAPVFSVSLVLLLARAGRREPVGELLGGLSFALYLNAWIIGFVLNSALKHAGMTITTAGALASYAVAVGAAAAHFLLIERPILRARGRFYTDRLGRRFRIAAYGLFAIGVAIGLHAWGLPYWN